MVFTKRIDDLARRLADAMPGGVREARQDVEKNFRTVLHGAFERMELVTREEFDVQREVLARSRAKLDALEQRVAELEAQLGEGATGSKAGGKGGNKSGGKKGSGGQRT